MAFSLERNLNFAVIFFFQGVVAPHDIGHISREATAPRLRHGFPLDETCFSFFWGLWLFVHASFFERLWLQ
jgi:hypothetical protein